MPADHVLRLRRTDAEGEYLLVNVAPSGPAALDLRLVASEGEHVYPASIRESSVHTLQASNYSGRLTEWKATLGHALLRERAEAAPPHAVDGLETVAAISGTAVTITFRKNISGITQRLGSVKLEQNDEEAINPFEWAGTAVAASDELRVQLESLRTSVTAHQDEVAKLNQQLDGLVKAKKEHEAELFKQFATLLNSKKLKIRDQQRLLAGTHVNPQATESAIDSPESRSTRRPRKVTVSRTNKRKAKGITEPEPDDQETASEDEDGADSARQETPPPSNAEATADESDDSSGFSAAPVTSGASTRQPASKSKTSAMEKPKGDRGGTGEAECGDELPPKRQLPFQKKIATKMERTPKSMSVATPEEDSTDEEEL